MFHTIHNKHCLLVHFITFLFIQGAFIMHSIWGNSKQDNAAIFRACLQSIQNQCQKLGKIFTGPMYKLLLSFTVILDVYRSFIPNVKK